MAKRDYYDVLGVERAATEADIKKAFRKKAMEHHPDRNQHDPKSEARFKEVNEAYDVLRDGQKKAAYDRFGHAAFENGDGAAGFRAGQADFGLGLFRRLRRPVRRLHRRRRGGRGQRAARGLDLRYNLSLKLEDAYRGKPATITVPSSAACEVCEGTGAERRLRALDLPDLLRPRQGPRPAGLLHRRAHLPDLRRPRPDHQEPLHRLRGAGRVRRDRTLNVNVPARTSR